MSRQIFRDVEESLAREVRRITFNDNRTLSREVLQDTFDPFTGEVVSLPIEPNFYDSSADTNNIQYPHFFIRLLKTREDRFTGRVVPQYGRWIETPVQTSQRAFDIITSSSDGTILAPGNEFKTGVFQIAKVQPGNLLRLLAGNNIGTYKISSVTISNSGDHSIFVSNTLVENLPTALFDSNLRNLVFTSPIDLHTVKVGDDFQDSLIASFPITAININTNTITLGGVGTPSLLANGKIIRVGNVFQAADLSLVRFLILDQTKPISIINANGDTLAGADNIGSIDPPIPIDAYYLIRIDSKERDTHIDILNRVWEEFNPPRTFLPVIVRSALSFEQTLTQDVTSGGSQIINVSDNSGFNLNDTVFIIDDLFPTISPDSKSDRPFESIVVEKISTNQLKLQDVVPDTFTTAKTSKIISNADFELLMFHFVDHVTKDVEAAQYWVHEFTFWVQIFVDKLEDVQNNSVITQITESIEDLNTNTVIIEDP